MTMETKLQTLLDKIYELEGLVHLALKRDVSSKDFLRLIIKKEKEVNQLCESLNPEDLQVNTESKERAKDLNVPESINFAPIFDFEEKESEQDPFYSLDEYEIEEEAEPEEEEKPSARTENTQRGKLVFSINERFRFRKELFDNSDADFNNTLALVASMDNYEEAEDYFLNEEGFETSNPVVREFLDVIKRYFK